MIVIILKKYVKNMDGILKQMASKISKFMQNVEAL